MGTNNYKLVNGLLFYRKYLVVPNVNNLYTNLIREAHEQPLTIHPGIRKTYELLRKRYYWKGIKSFIA